MIIGGLMLCYLLYQTVSLCRSNCERRETIREQQRVRARVAEGLARDRREEEQREQEEQEAKRKISKTLRMEQIMNALKFEILADEENQTESCGNSDDEDASGSRMQNEQADEAGDIEGSLSAAICSSERKGNKQECVICLQPYTTGQVVCSSKTTKCHHIFHEECAIGWLQESNECPLCRIDLLETSEVTA